MGQTALEYISKLPFLKAEFRSTAKSDLTSGTTARIVQGTYGYIDSLKTILVELAGFYPKNHFSGKLPSKFFSDLIESRFLWHGLHLEPHGVGTGGTIIGVLCSDKVARDVEIMIEDMVTSLLAFDESELAEWLVKWRSCSTD
jgi:hypothetical protein